MNKNLKKNIKSAFNAPEAAMKYEFLQRLSFPKATYSDFIFSQIGYIRKRVWVISIILMLIVLCSLRFLPSEGIIKFTWFVSSLFPFIALVTITEISRSTICNMAELEMSCKHSLSDIVLVRLSAVCGFNTIVFTSILLMLAKKTDYSMLQLSAYIFTPFMLTCTMSLAALNYLKTSETNYVCGGVSCFVSTLNGVFVNTKQIAYTERFLFIWYVVLMVLFFIMLFQALKLIKKMEEFVWNLQLTD